MQHISVTLKLPVPKIWTEKPSNNVDLCLGDLNNRFKLTGELHVHCTVIINKSCHEIEPLG